MFDTMGGPRRHPSIDKIMGAQLPPSWKGLNVDRYDETKNSDEHMDIYTTKMSLFTSDYSILCRVFPTTLKGRALSWFTRLPPYFIDYIETLTSKFGTKFTTSRPHHLTSIVLVNVCQEKRKSLRVFIKVQHNITEYLKFEFEGVYASYGNRTTIRTFC